MVTIREISKNKKKYYYLEHSIRNKSKIIVKRKYLGDKLPKNIKEIKEEFEIKIIEDKYKKQIEAIAKKQIKEFNKLPKIVKLNNIESFLVKFTYNTNKIEGSTITLKETYDLLELGLSPSNKPIHDIKETEGHKKAFYEMINFKKKLTLNEVLYWHKLIFSESNKEIAGKIREHGVAIARSKVKLALPIEIQPMLNEFFQWYNKIKINPVLKAALVHLKFVTIHPFSDGNGRLSRLLMNYVLYSNNYPMINIDYKERKSYYNAVEKSQLKGTVIPFLNFTSKEFIKKIK